MFLAQSFFEHTPKRFVANQPPISTIVVARRGFARKSFDNNIGAQTAHNLDHKVDILPDLPKTELRRVAVVVFGHRRCAKDLQLMKFDRGERQRIYRRNLGQNLLVALARQTEYKVRSRMDSALGRHLDCSASRRKVVATIDALQRAVEGRFYTIFECNIATLGQRCKVVEFCLIDTIGARTDHNTRHQRVGHSLVVEPTQMVEWCIGIGEGLKIGQISTCRTVATLMKLNALVDLLRDALFGLAIRWRKGGIVAEGTTARRNRTVAIGAGETRIDGHLLHSAAKESAKVCRVTVVWSIVAPLIHRAKVVNISKQCATFGENRTFYLQKPPLFARNLPYKVGTNRFF